MHTFYFPSELCARTPVCIRTHSIFPHLYFSVPNMISNFQTLIFALLTLDFTSKLSN
ncbi:uncharacterized protein DS421_7g220470 [Arachis hypogaea]|nr:uncharacterized protein DS421_7g220470 [Arachis hypogaea]